MSKEQPVLTPWYPPSVKPAREGMYVASANIPPNEDCFRYWDGELWRGCDFGSFDTASPGPDGSPSDFQDTIQWRGLAEQPK